MAHTTEEHYHSGEGSNAMSAIFIAVVLLAFILFLFFVFGRGLFTTNPSAPSISVPEQIDVNVNDGGQQ